MKIAALMKEQKDGFCTRLSPCTTSVKLTWIQTCQTSPLRKTCSCSRGGRANGRT